MLFGVAVAVFLSIVFGKTFWRTLVYSECISLGCWLFIDGGRALAARWVHRRRPDRADPCGDDAEWPGWGWMSACVLFGSIGGALLGHAVADALLGADSRVLDSGPDALLALMVISLVPGIAATWYFQARSRLQALQANAEAAQRQAAEHQLRLLESQLEPHMLFNTLANLRVLIGLEPARAQEMLDRLIAYLRATLGGSRVALHPLRAEFERLADYLALMRVRMGHRLQEALRLPGELGGLAVPPLLLQPLVENAIKHGLEAHVEGGRLEIEAVLDGGQLVLRVRDTGAGLAPGRGAAPAARPEAAGADPAPSGGFGLAQVRERLATLYGEAASLELCAVPAAEGGGTLATVRLPARPMTPAVPSTATHPR
ncbi:autolysin sensor kinase [Piscinibacter sakaiensis]|uniref:histidine kinase n=2 Tax=Piscinibacter sakaiensis TaxID=1547922 RepID=A0A0K8P2A6_PISS1|nr:autolysin sensor kinase [Piscinibacter sakaiensis]